MVGIIELFHVLLFLFGHLFRFQPLFCEDGVVGVVEVHPHCEDLAHVFLAAEGVLAEEGEGAVLHEVAGDDGFDDDVQDDQFLDELHEALLLSALEFVGEVEVVVTVLVVVVQLALVQLPFDGEQVGDLGGADQHRPLVGALDHRPGDVDQVGQLVGQHLLREEPLGGKVELAQSEVVEVQLEELPQFAEGGVVGYHPPLLEGRVVAEVHSLYALREQACEQGGRFEHLGQFVLLHHAVVILEEVFALGHSLPDQGDVVLVKAKILEGLGEGIDIELAFPGVVVVLDELGPFLDVGPLSFDEVGEVGRNHGDNVFDVHFVDQLGKEQAVLFFGLYPCEEDLPTRVHILGFFFGAVVHLLQDQAIGYVEPLSARGLFLLLLFWRQVIEKIAFHYLCLFLQLYPIQLLLQFLGMALQLAVVVVDVSLELLLQFFVFVLGGHFGQELLQSFVLFVVFYLLLMQESVVVVDGLFAELGVVALWQLVVGLGSGSSGFGEEEAGGPEEG